MLPDIVREHAVEGGFTHYVAHTDPRGGVFALYRPAPAFPGRWGTKVVFARADQATGYYLDAPSILSWDGLPEHSLTV